MSEANEQAESGSGRIDGYPSFGRPTGDKLTISKQARKIDQMRETIDQLHERLAAVQSSKRNKASQIARLKAAIQTTIDDNLHLADGDDCTLIHLKRAIGYEVE